MAPIARAAAAATLFLLAAVSAAASSSEYWHAAHCVANGVTCTPFYAKGSRYACRARLRADWQTPWCVTVACRWCALDTQKRNSYPCTSPRLRPRCPKPTPKPPPRRPGKLSNAQLSEMYFHSVKCVAADRDCSTYFASRSAGCWKQRSAWTQRPSCIRAACRWCAFDSSKYSPLCRAPVLRARCRNIVKPASNAPPPPPPPTRAPSTATPLRTTRPTPTTRAPSTTKPAPKPLSKDAPTTSLPPTLAPAPAGSLHAAGSCTWEGDDSVMIDLGRVKPTTGWYRTRQFGLTGLVFRPYWDHGLAQPHQGGPMCFPVRVQKEGDYFLTFVSYAPHVTEYNDAWVMSKDLALRMSHTSGARSLAGVPGIYHKAYQGNGPDAGLSVEMKTVDSDGHRFVLLDARAGQRFRVCLSGRSFRFSVFRIVLQRCEGKICDGMGLWKDRVLGMPVSKCV